jgi:peptide/nickel transport system ATP-binding protein
MSGSNAPLLQLEDVQVHFEQNQGLLDRFVGKRSENAVKAVDGVSLNLEENDVVALVGESGCGKTTLGKTAVGLQRPTSGSVKYRGQDIWKAKDKKGDVDIQYKDIRRSLQIIHQDPGSSLNPNKTIMKSLQAPLKKWQPGLSAEDRRTRILGMLEHVGMAPPDDYANRFPHQLSGGEKQRTALVRALLMNPDVILADEAVSALDVSLRVDTMDLLLNLQDEFNTSFVFVSHNLSNARYLAQKAGGRIGVMYLGRLVEIGPAEELLQNPRHPYTQVLRWATADLDPDKAKASKPPVRAVDIPDPSNPPSGCRFHTRCPKAHEVCVHENPNLVSRPDDSDVHSASCFRQFPEREHEYWNSPPLEGVEDADTTLPDDSHANGD